MPPQPLRLSLWHAALAGAAAAAGCEVGTALAGAAARRWTLALEGGGGRRQILRRPVALGALLVTAWAAVQAAQARPTGVEFWTGTGAGPGPGELLGDWEVKGEA